MGPQGGHWEEQLVKREARWSVRDTHSFVTLQAVITFKLLNNILKKNIQNYVH